MRLASNAHFLLTSDAGQRIVTLRRTAVVFNSAEEMEKSWGQLFSALGGITPNTWGLLVDARQAPARNDPIYEKNFLAHRNRFMALFGAYAAVFGSALGVAQVRRYGGNAFLDVGEAETFLRNTLRDSEPG